MADKKIPYKIYLNEDEMPKSWYNLRADMKNKPAPLLNPGTLQPLKAEELAPIFCEELVAQELDETTPYIEIPEEIRDFYKMYRPSPLVRAYCLEEKLQTPAKIYYKFEGNNTSGSHKLNSAIAQAYYAKKQGLKGVTTETGAGQWGTALSMACSYFENLRRLCCSLPFRDDRSRQEDPRRASRDNRKSRLCDFRGSGSRYKEPRLPLCSGQCPEPGPAAPVRYRSGDQDCPG